MEAAQYCRIMLEYILLRDVMGRRGTILAIIVLYLAARSRDEEGRLLIESNPLRGLKAPSEKNPTRVMLTQAEYEALLRVAGKVDWRFRVALVLAHETGHRIGAIRQLRWSDIDSEAGICRDHLILRDFKVEFPPFDSRQMRF